MHSRTWIKLLQRMPAEKHEMLAITTSSGTEISIQTVLRLDEDFVLIKGRLSGTTDLGRVFFIPYDQINFLGITKEVKESEIGALLGETPRIAPTVQRILDTPTLAQAQEPTPAALTETPEPLPAAATAQEPPPPVKPNERLAIPRRSGLIARLRARTNVTEAPETQGRT
jgi:hypothetical protein